MAQQARDPLNAGISNRFFDGNGFINRPMWNEAAEAGDIVGTCRRPGCDGLLKAAPTHQDGQITWYRAECISDKCGAEMAAPNGRILRRSSRRTEMPAGFWERREDLLKKLQTLASSEG